MGGREGEGEWEGGRVSGKEGGRGRWEGCRVGRDVGWARKSVGGGGGSDGSAGRDASRGVKVP